MTRGNQVVIVDAVRTPIGKYNGALKDIRPDDLGAIAIKALLERNPYIQTEEIEEVILGNANQAGEDNRNVARMSALLAGLPVSVGGVTVNRLCGSGLDAINQAFRALTIGEGDIMIAGGTESMTRAPFVMAKPENQNPRGNITMYDTTIGWRFTNPSLHHMYGSLSMPETAQCVAERFSISREDQDQFAYESQMKTARAIESEVFYDEIVPILVQNNRGEGYLFTRDEHARPDTTLEKLSSLKSIVKDGTITAGNASGINDGASVLLMMTEDKANELGVKPLVRVLASAVHGVEPDIMGYGPVFASKKALERAGLSVEQLDLIELNEAFAAQALACLRDLGLDPQKVNVNGGAIALGHPLGASGARIMTTLIHEMKRRKSKYGLATMCIGVGQGIATVVERVED
ncbi:thiolase family protein [Brevibacillus daliensis]|uniref:thiolase family protein n=1 Tax=Brevibacillus daliensis TaxID=2892995 RepID=UPI001E530CFF|nr:acetyl-CoA C-acyltransferase [Brevibacillus daliensis]